MLLLHCNEEPDGDEFVETLNVHVGQSSFPPTEESMAKLTEGLKKQYAVAGVTISDFQTTIQKLGVTDVIVVQHMSKYPFNEEPLWQRQAFFQGGGKTFVVTCTASMPSHEAYEETFQQMLNSFRTPRSGFIGNNLQTSAILGGIVGAIIGGLAWLVKKWVAKPKPSPETAPAFEDEAHLRNPPDQGTSTDAEGE